MCDGFAFTWLYFQLKIMEHDVPGTWYEYITLLSVWYRYQVQERAYVFAV